MEHVDFKAFLQPLVGIRHLNVMDGADYSQRHVHETGRKRERERERERERDPMEPGTVTVKAL